MESVKSFLSTISPQCLGELLFLEIFFCYMLPTIGFFFGIPVGWYTFPLALITSIAAYVPFRKSDVKISTEIVISLLCWTVCILLMLPVIDRSYDGNGYHQEIVAALYSGWIPIDGESWTGVPLSLWCLHYAKGLEIAESSVVALTGLMESGKCINILVAISAGFILFGFLSSLFPQLCRRWRWAVVAVALSNPVFICQSLTYYIDYSKYFFTLITILYLIEICSHKDKSRGLLMFCCVIIFAAGTKFNAFFELGVTVLACIIWLAAERRWREAWRIAWVSTLAAIVGAGVIGWHPYMTNFLSAGHPLYPLMGEGSVDIMTYNTPPEYLMHDRFSNFFRSLCTISIPRIDTREGGFGFLIVPMLVIALYTVWTMRKKCGYVPLYICSCILISCFFFEQSWWARYITQLWLIPVVGATVGVGYGHKSIPIMSCVWGILVCALSTAASSLAVSLGATLRHTLYRRVVEDVLKGQTVEVYGLKESHRRHMLEADIKGVYVDSISHSGYIVPYYGVLSDWQHCPMMLLDSVTYVKIRENLDAIPFFDYGLVFDYDGIIRDE